MNIALQCALYLFTVEKKWREEEKKFLSIIIIIANLGYISLYYLNVFRNIDGEIINKCDKNGVVILLCFFLLPFLLCMQWKTRIQITL